MWFDIGDRLVSGFQSIDEKLDGLSIILDGFLNQNFLLFADYLVEFRFYRPYSRSVMFSNTLTVFSIFIRVSAICS